MTFRRGDDPNAPWSVRELQLQVVDNSRFHITTPFRYLSDTQLVPPTSHGFPGNDEVAETVATGAAAADPPALPATQQLTNGKGILVPGWPLDPAEVAGHATTPCRACTDLASVPRVIRGILGTYGPQLAAALTHDELCHRVELMNGRANKRAGRDYADATFLEAMRTTEQPDRISAYQARLFWGGVSIVRYFSYRVPQAIGLLVEMVAGWAVCLLALQVGLLAFSGRPLRAAWGSHWYTEAWLPFLVFVTMLLVSGYAIGRSKDNGIAWSFFWLSALPAIYALCLWLPLPLTQRHTVPIVHWVINYGAVLPCVILLLTAAAVVLAGALLRRPPDRFLGLIAISALPWALPVAILTFIAQHALQMPDSDVAVKPLLPSATGDGELPGGN